MNVLLLHGYSADNAGDGLLVHEAITIIRDALGPVSITLIASRPDTFEDLGVTVLPAIPTFRGWNPLTRAALKNINSFDLVVAVGGGYLRAGTPKEAAKSALVHGPQLRAAARSRTPTIYLPQSVGPARFGTSAWLRKHLSRIDKVMLRDDRSVAEFSGVAAERIPDLATLAAAQGRQPSARIAQTPVLSIRSVRGRVSPDVYRLASDLSPYDAYIQSTVSGNDDRAATASLSPERIIDRSELLAAEGPRRVVIAVRLHAALMALASGHYVIHLAYERKGFGAFADLGITTWVHNVNRFDSAQVIDQASTLLRDANARATYDADIFGAAEHIRAARAQIVDYVRKRGGRT